MKTKKLFIYILTIFIFLITIVGFKMPKVEAVSSGMRYVKTSTGGNATYLDQSLKVEVPTTYSKRPTEFRGVWVSPFAGDINGFNYGMASTKSQLIEVLDTMEENNLNTIVFHIRTHNDALYDTMLAPKSKYVEKVNFKEWDYLTWFIEECHSRGIEFHAWMNPYRIKAGSKTSVNEITKEYENCFKNPARKADNILVGTDGAILDPGSPEVQKYLVDVCMEVIKKYDVDAIHFDDYFYMKGIDDSRTFNLYHNKFNTTDKEEFRRLQVDKFIEDLSKAMYEYNIQNNRAVQLGISPSGVYRNGSYNTNYKYDNNGTLISPLGSNSRGYSHYDYPLYSDVKKWIDNEWIDYVVPQLYGSFENRGARYSDMVDWWSHVVKYKKVNFYPGIGIYQIQGHSDPGWYTNGLNTFESSLLYNQKFDEVKGFCLYTYKTIKSIGKTNPDLKNVFTNLLTTKALNPKSLRYDLKVETPSFKIYKGNGNYTLKIDDNKYAYKFAIYKSKGEIDVNDPTNLIGYVRGKDLITYVDKEKEKDINYGIRMVNHANNISSLVTINTKDALTNIDFPIAKLNNFTYEGEVKANEYLQILIEKASLNAGINANYVLYVSNDQKTWTILKEYDNPNELVLRWRYQFNDDLKPVYMKYTVENEYGKLESDVLTIDYSRLKASIVLDKILKEVEENIKGIFNIR